MRFLKTIGILMKVLVSVKYFLIFCIVKFIENSKKHVNQMKHMYQINRNEQN